MTERYTVHAHTRDVVRHVLRSGIHTIRFHTCVRLCTQTRFFVLMFVHKRLSCTLLYYKSSYICIFHGVILRAIIRDTRTRFFILQSSPVLVVPSIFPPRICIYIYISHITGKPLICCKTKVHVDTCLRTCTTICIPYGLHDLCSVKQDTQYLQERFTRRHACIN